MSSQLELRQESAGCGCLLLTYVAPEEDLPFAETQGLLTDEDVFRILS